MLIIMIIFMMMTEMMMMVIIMNFMVRTAPVAASQSSEGGIGMSAKRLDV